MYERIGLSNYSLLQKFEHVIGAPNTSDRTSCSIHIILTYPMPYCSLSRKFASAEIRSQGGGHGSKLFVEGACCYGG